MFDPLLSLFSSSLSCTGPYSSQEQHQLFELSIAEYKRDRAEWSSCKEFCNAKGLVHSTFSKFVIKDVNKRKILQPFMSNNHGGSGQRASRIVSKAEYEEMADNHLDSDDSQLRAEISAAYPHLTANQRGDVKRCLKRVIEKKKARSNALAAAVEASVAAAVSSRQQQVQMPAVAAASGEVDSNEEVPPLPALPPLPAMPTMPDEWF